MKMRAIIALRRMAEAVARRCAEIEFRELMRKRREDGAHFVGALITTCLTIAMLASPSCGPSRATQTAIDEANRMGAECEQHAASIAESATSLAEGRALLAAEQARCVALGCSYCAAHHLDCTSLGLVCAEAP